MLNYNIELPSTSDIVKMNNSDDHFFIWMKEKVGINEFDYSLMSFSERKRLLDSYNNNHNK